MRDWTPWEWIAYACLCVASMIIAADTGVRLSPELAVHMPDFVHGAIWGFAPLALVVTATAVLVAHDFGWVGSKVQADKGQPKQDAVASSNAGQADTKETAVKSAIDTRAWFHDASIAMLASNEINQAIVEAVKRLNAIRDKSVGLEARRREVSTNTNGAKD